MKVHILDDWFDTLRGLPCFARLAGHDVTVWTDHLEDAAALAERLCDAEALVLFRERTKITADAVGSPAQPAAHQSAQRLPAHRRAGLYGANGVLLCSNMHAGTPSYAAAELTWALVLAGMRQLPAQMASLKAGNWQMGVGKTLRGRTMGLYGYGRIGRAVAGYAEAFGMQVQWWSSEDGRDRAAADGQRVAENRQALFAQSDVVSVHVRLKPETQSLISLEDLTAMRRDALFVNTSRSGLVQRGALLEALNLGRPGLAAVDVFDTEPLTDADDPLLRHPNLIGTPHIGYVTEDEFDLQFSDIFDQINAFAEGAPINMINPEVWEARRG